MKRSERIVRSYEATSERMRTCHVCERTIFSGDRYEGTIIAVSEIMLAGEDSVQRRWLKTVFRHIEPDCFGSDPSNFEDELEDADAYEEDLAA